MSDPIKTVNGCPCVDLKKVSVPVSHRSNVQAVPAIAIPNRYKIVIYHGSKAHYLGLAIGEMVILNDGSGRDFAGIVDHIKILPPFGN